jgi:hypothetical protein
MHAFPERTVFRTQNHHTHTNLRQNSRPFDFTVYPHPLPLSPLHCILIIKDLLLTCDTGGEQGIRGTECKYMYDSRQT